MRGDITKLEDQISWLPTSSETQFSSLSHRQIHQRDYWAVFEARSNGLVSDIMEKEKVNPIRNSKEDFHPDGDTDNDEDVEGRI